MSTNFSSDPKFESPRDDHEQRNEHPLIEEDSPPKKCTVSGEPAPNQLLGDIFALIGATCYGLSNTFEEFCVKKRPLHEVVGQMGVFEEPKFEREYDEEELDDNVNEKDLESSVHT
ncbi:2329_t:CDS:2 [Racocetra fulgida]|uniref:2329_t:CDS:1 n=1 Tax=Racocetra fulgida TaxID=60492 RepID=A0A9N9G194_9GLOM|nr:2329_t:CDS:2 [Racocetra fulgida]